MRRLVKALVRIVDRIEASPVILGRGRSRKTIYGTTKIYLNFNSLNINMIYDNIT